MEGWAKSGNGLADSVGSSVVERGWAAASNPFSIDNASFCCDAKVSCTADSAVDGWDMAAGKGSGVRQGSIPSGAVVSEAVKGAPVTSPIPEAIPAPSIPPVPSDTISVPGVMRLAPARCPSCVLTCRCSTSLREKLRPQTSHTRVCPSQRTPSARIFRTFVPRSGYQRPPRTTVPSRSL